MTAILHHRFSDNVVRFDQFAARRPAGGHGALLCVWTVGADGALACRWRPAQPPRRNLACGPGA